MARDDDIFRKLKKQTPIIKRKDIQPLTSRDFAGKSAFGVEIEKSKKKVSKKASSGDVEVFSRTSMKAQRAKSKPAAPQSRASRQQAPKIRRELEMFGESKPVAQKQAEKVLEQTRLPKQAEKAAESTRLPKQAEKAIEQPHRLPKRAEKTIEQPSREPQMPRTKSTTDDAPRRSPGLEKAFPGMAPVRPEAELDVLPGAKRTVRARLAEHQPRRHEQTHSLVEPDEAVVLLAAPEKGGLSFRHELKYYINYRDYILLRNTLKALLPLDRFSGPDGDYHIRSLYFDDIYETALAEKIAGTDFRHKYRIRIYNHSDGTIKFEKKIKRGQYIAKQSISLGRDECDSLIAGDFSVLEGRRESLAEEIYLQMKNNCLRPRVIVDYIREAYVSPVESVRITFDKDLKAGLQHHDIFDTHVPTMPILDSGLMVLEVKFNKYLPPHIKGVINSINAAQRNAISKYVLCRWHD